MISPVAPAQQPNMTGETGPITASLPVDMTIAGFFAIACYNCVEILISLLNRFRRHDSLYFWSIVVATLGIVLHSIVVLLRYYSLGPNFPLAALTCVGWYGMVTGQSVVLYSRLHLIVSDRAKTRWVLVMIITDFFILHVPVTVMFLGSNTRQSSRFLPAFNLYERIQLAGFSIQETIISGLYIWEASRGLKPIFAIRRTTERKVIRHLIIVNVLVVLLDVSLIITQYLDHFQIATTYKPVVYSIKLKMEFVVLNKLLLLVRHRECNYTTCGAFFPPLPAVFEDEGTRPRWVEVDMPNITLDEVEQKVMAAKAWKAPGEDGLPAMVWKQLWPVAQDRVLHLFRTSLIDGVLPDQWRCAKIIQLKKPGKGNYAIAKPWRPISLLSTLGKILEAVVADRISYAVETFGLLPTNHFGVRKRRSAEQALLLFQEQVYKTWRNRKVVSLISFDVKGAYNGVFKERLLQRLEARGMPQWLVRWVGAFCSNRTASIVVNGHTSEQRELLQAGLPQGSPLSPVLFLFFNADLVQIRIDSKGGSIAFVNDYSAWVTRPTAEANRAGIQAIIDRALDWERRSGAAFEGGKTSFVHFTRNPERTSEAPLVIKGKEVKPKQSAKILGEVKNAKTTVQGTHGKNSGQRAVGGHKPKKTQDVTAPDSKNPDEVIARYSSTIGSRDDQNPAIRLYPRLAYKTPYFILFSIPEIRNLYLIKTRTFEVKL
ncbi:hypothetical protein BFJ68_g17121 [Fusarium oxysporum]|uniref:Reverse transcriptase domain-containing protein n=4 Tax=Fusarium oxysporum TaxID=5507 RepID=A0A420P2T0_FUSOX|nr:hypothetical protein BFJ65_g18773 [Fusarium oxysporum f. sp. cepae]RKK30771.1 hypothetical protein BFJ66_g16152 [Fusarium oxysporum f. sp. cepae]RKK30967.1 hypothetical protein BFJ67_g15476 [Fusarium oxysporum f. sp. cepae]RKK59928.1 hypothetical protein BFJ69_g17261 [Fusarium oxysporum]RKK86821.1 hypothetical protein BFJ68_g17121 [Fusarium oxysporum]